MNELVDLCVLEPSTISLTFNQPWNDHSATAVKHSFNKLFSIIGMRPLIVFLLAVSVYSSAAAQSAADPVALGDKDYLALNAAGALTHYEQALAADARNFDALWKASRSAVDIGSYSPDDAKRSALFARAEQYARRAIALNPTSPEGHFALARALGKTALAQSVRARVKYATSIRSEALECLKYDPTYAGCLHVMGMWNAEVMRLSGLTRMIAKNFLGGQVFGSASWASAVSYMQKSVAADPDRIVHHLDLGGIYRDTGDRGRARSEFETVLRLPVTDVNDPHYKDEAKAALESL
jgi:tetratricopeptide (TPR) repeat protein